LLRRPDSAALAHLCAHLNAEAHLTFGPDLPVPAEYPIFVAGRPQREHLTASPNLHRNAVPSDALHSLLPQADVLIICLLRTTPLKRQG
jgi:hypothetical protein